MNGGLVGVKKMKKVFPSFFIYLINFVKVNLHFLDQRAKISYFYQFVTNYLRHKSTNYG